MAIPDYIDTGTRYLDIFKLFQFFYKTPTHNALQAHKQSDSNGTKSLF